MTEQAIPYVVVCRPAGYHLVGPFENYTEASCWGVREQDIRFYVVMLSPDDAHAPPSVLSPTHAAAIQRQERAIAAERVRERVA